MSISITEAVFVSLLGASALFSAAGAVLLSSLRRRPRPEPEEILPVTVLKPMAGAFPGLRDAAESFFLQTHRRCQLVFGFRTADDEARPIIEELCRRHRHVDCDIVITGPDAGPNRKVAALSAMISKARHDLLLICDDDVTVPPDYVARMAGLMRDERLGAATSPYRVRPGTAGLALDGLTRATELLPSVAVAEMLERGLSFTLGASSIFRRRALEDIGGIQSLSDFLAEDYHLGARIRARGWTVGLSGEMVELGHDFQSVGDYLRHQLRWSRTYRFCRPVGFFFSILIQGVFLTAVGLVATGASATILAAAAATMAIRWISAGIDIALVGHRSLLVWLPLLPVRDLMSVGFWAAGFLGREVDWRGRRFRVNAGGRITPVTGS